MSRPSEKLSRRWSTMNVPRRRDASFSEESSSSTSESTEQPSYTKNTSTPLRNRWSDAKGINRSSRNQRDESEDSEGETDEKEVERSRGHKKATRDVRGKRQDDRERIARRQKARHVPRGGRKRERGYEGSENDNRMASGSSSKRYEEGDTDRSKRRHEGENELPITEILKRSQENARTKYEGQSPLSELTTDKIYVQHRDGFSAMKINRSKSSQFSGQKSEMAGGNGFVENRDSPPIKVAITIQWFWKTTGLVFQGILGGMALMHFIMLQVFFNPSLEFIEDHSTICEIYTNIFSFLITLCVVSTLDKFDFARFDVDHLREIYLDHNIAVIAIPLYLVVFCLHQVCSKVDSQLGLVHYYSSNYSLWENATDVQTLLVDLNNWQRMSLSKDVLAVVAWLFVSLGTKDDSFLIHLQSMQKFTSNAESPRQ
ncbi:PREDICTED: uncharacterized protein LOC107188632 [Dufourea novaeangliae]|uniref:uncharacterized protein LOC107188632 n=1 Tax=Dufourea novaeangliae TaxID=178035 RepID=UPI00076793F7|nr:PREDICTED: uncharacterized protein LOC107188632 [Dufourea novaeangliae]